MEEKVTIDKSWGVTVLRGWEDQEETARDVGGKLTPSVFGKGNGRYGSRIKAIDQYDDH